MFNQYKNTTWETLRWFYEVSSHFLSNTGDIRLYSCTIGFIVVWKYLHTSCGIKVRLRRVGPKENAGTTFLISARENWPGIDYYPQRRAVATYSIQSSITIPREGLWLRTQFILQKIKLRKGGIPNPTSRRSRTSWRTEGRQLTYNRELCGQRRSVHGERANQKSGSFSAVSKPNFESKYSLESSRRAPLSNLQCFLKFCDFCC